MFDHKAYTEKSLSRLIKAKAKAERAAARLAAANIASLATGGPPITAASVASTSAVIEDSPAPESAADAAPSPADPDAPPATPAKEPPVSRIELLRSNPEVVGRFMQLMVPILVDVYAASVVTPVRVKSLTGLLKAVSFLDADELKRVFTVSGHSAKRFLRLLTSLQFVPVASFASSILSSKDSPSLVIGALQLVELLLIKVPAEYKPAFRREGVFHEIEALATRALASAKAKEKDKEKDKDASENASPAEGSAPAPASGAASLAFVPGYKKLSSLAIEPDDAITLRARVIKFKYLSGDEADDGDDLSASLGRLVARLSEKDLPEKDIMPALVELSTLFASPHSSVSSFELLQSGVVDGLLSFISDTDRAGKYLCTLLHRLALTCRTQ